MSATRSSLFPDQGSAPAAPRSSGILPAQAIRELIEAKRLYASHEISEEQIQPASIDMRLGPVAYRVRASFLPGPLCAVEQRLANLVFAEIDLTKGAVFDKGCVYIVPLMEELRLPKDIEAKANPKSTTGRLDIFTRLITDRGTEFERVERGYQGKLYAEIVSRTFTIQVRSGMSLSQIRFIRGNPPTNDKTLVDLDQKENLVYEAEDLPGRANIDDGLRISVKLRSARESDIVAYKAKKNAPILDLGQRGTYEPGEFWDTLRASQTGSLILDPGDFYLLASKERIRVPPDYAAEMVPFDPSIGEFRVHYAGFFDPGFGYGSSDIQGTLAVLEVRAHEVPLLIDHGQVIGRLVYSRMTARPEKIYGQAIGSSYQMQGLSLSKQFKKS